MNRIRAEKSNLWLGAGVLFSLILCMPYLFWGENAVVTYHDQLDGELITYLLNAKHLFQNIPSYPEIMGGIPKNGMVSPAPLYILFFKVFTPYTAFLCCMVSNRLIQFLFLFLLADRLTGRKPVAFAAGMWFACLPFYPVYGLCIPGLPMLFYAFLLLSEEEGERKKSRMLLPCFLILLYGAASSLALCGFACLFLLLCRIVFCLIRREKVRAMRLMTGTAVLAGTYMICNISLIKQILPFLHEEFQTHKREVRYSPAPFWKEFFSVLLRGEDYCDAKAVFVLWMIVPAFLWGLVVCLRLKKREGGQDCVVQKGLMQWKRLAGTLLLLCGIAFWRAFYQSEWMVRLRNESEGIFHDFNFGRFTWLMPPLWCLCFVYACDILLLLLKMTAERRKWREKALAACCSAVFIASAAAAAFSGLLSGDFKPNVVKLLRGGDYYMMTWSQFFAEDLFEQADALIGRPKEDYRVVSLGIYPAAASYNGFYCLDAYSNNYDLAYKHQFRRIIQPQLERSEYLRKWFDEWGNRCYLVLAQYNNYFTMEKRWGPYTDAYELDCQALREMGCDYILSALYLIDSEKNGLKLLNEEPIQTQESWYRLWIYEIDG